MEAEKAYVALGVLSSAILVIFFCFCTSRFKWNKKCFQTGIGRTCCCAWNNIELNGQRIASDSSSNSGATSNPIPSQLTHVQVQIQNDPDNKCQTLIPSGLENNAVKFGVVNETEAPNSLDHSSTFNGTYKSWSAPTHSQKEVAKVHSADIWRDVDRDLAIDKNVRIPQQSVPSLPFLLLSPVKKSRKRLKKNARAGVIVAVDATPKRCGGYCIQKELGLCEFYAIGKDELPWKLHNLSRRGNSAEFEMKNLMYALLNWEGVIRKTGKLWVYTDNMAIKGRRIGNSYGSTVRAYLNHLHNCHQVRIMNLKNHHVHRHKSPHAFLKYIQPADFLSRNMLVDFYQHMENLFPLITCLIKDDDFSKAEEQMDRLVRERCETCGFRIRVTASLRETIKRRANLKVVLN